MAGVRRFLYLGWLIDFPVLVLAEQFTNGDTLIPNTPVGSAAFSSLTDLHLKHHRAGPRTPSPRDPLRLRGEGPQGGRLPACCSSGLG